MACILGSYLSQMDETITLSPANIWVKSSYLLLERHSALGVFYVMKDVTTAQELNLLPRRSHALPRGQGTGVPTGDSWLGCADSLCLLASNPGLSQGIDRTWWKICIYNMLLYKVAIQVFLNFHLEQITMYNKFYICQIPHKMIQTCCVRN